MTTAEMLEEQRSAYRQLVSSFQYIFPAAGASALADWVAERVKGEGGLWLTSNDLLQELRTGKVSGDPIADSAQKAYDDQFPYLRELMAADIFPLAGGTSPEAAYGAYRRTTKDLVERYGLDETFSSNEAIRDYAVSRVNAVELENRMVMAVDAVERMPSEVKTLFKDYYGVEAADLTAYYLDPDQMETVLTNRWKAVRAGGAATQVGYAASRAQSEYVAGQNLSEDQARSGFTAARIGDYFRTGYGETLSTGDSFKGAFGDVAAARRGERVQRSRINPFSEGSGMNTDQSGVTSLGQ